MFNNIKNKIMFASLAAPVYAQDPVDNTKITIAPTGNFEPLKNLTAGGIVSGAISLTMLLAALIFFFVLILGGIKWVTSEGEEKKVTSARAQITNGLIGLAIVFAAFAIMQLIKVIFGVDVLNLTITTWNP